MKAFYSHGPKIYKPDWSVLETRVRKKWLNLVNIYCQVMSMLENFASTSLENENIHLYFSWQWQILQALTWKNPTAFYWNFLDVHGMCFHQLNFLDVLKIKDC